MTSTKFLGYCIAREKLCNKFQCAGVSEVKEKPGGFTSIQHNNTSRNLKVIITGIILLTKFKLCNRSVYLFSGFSSVTLFITHNSCHYMDEFLLCPRFLIFDLTVGNVNPFTYEWVDFDTFFTTG